MSEELRAREWRVNPETPSVIITPHGRISIGWSNQRAGEASEFALAEETAAMIVGLVNASFASSAAGQREGWKALVAPWADHNGPLPDYDSPVACVFDSGVQYAVELLAKELGVTDWTPCDGTEEYDGDLGGTLMNIVGAALPKDADGDPIWPADLHRLIASPSAPEERRDEVAELLRAARWYVADSLEAHEHSDGRDLLTSIDAALAPGNQEHA